MLIFVLFADDQQTNRTGKVTPDFSNLPCHKLSDAKAIVKLYLGNGLATGVTLGPQQWVEVCKQVWQVIQFAR